MTDDPGAPRGSLLSAASRILGARVLSGILTWTGTLLLVTWLPRGEYAQLALWSAIGGFGTAALYTLFLKHAQLAGAGRAFLARFARLQVALLVVGLLVVAGMTLLLSGGRAEWPRFATIALWILAVGSKEVFGEVLRTNSRFRSYALLYVGDALARLLIFTVLLLRGTDALAILLVMSCSSVGFTVLLWPAAYSELAGDAELPAPTLRELLGRSGPLLLSSLAGAAFVLVFRAAVNAIAPKGAADVVHAAYDLLQRPYALITTSLFAAVMPRLRSGTRGPHVRAMAEGFAASFCGLCGVGVAVWLLRRPAQAEELGILVFAQLLAILHLARVRPGLYELPFLKARATWALLPSALLLLVTSPLLLLPGSLVTTFLVAMLVQTAVLLQLVVPWPRAPEMERLPRAAIWPVVLPWLLVLAAWSPWPPLTASWTLVPVGCVVALAGAAFAWRFVRSAHV